MRYSWLSVTDFEARNGAAESISAVQTRVGYGGEWPGDVQPLVSEVPEDPFDPSKYWAYFSETD